MNNEDTNCIVEYTIDSFILMKDDEKIELDFTNVMLIDYLNDYENNIMPLVQIKIKIDARKYRWILKNKKDIKVKLTIDKKYSMSSADPLPLSTQACIDGEFILMIQDQDIPLDTNLIEESFKKNNDGYETDIDVESYLESENILDIYLFNEDFLISSKKMVNKVYKKSTIQNIIGEILTSTKHTDVLMSKVENDEEYVEMIVPCLPVYKAILYLDQYYGLYKRGSLIFYDIDAVYLLNLDYNKPVKREGEDPEVNVNVLQKVQMTPGYGITIKNDDNKQYMNVTEEDIRIHRVSMIKEMDIGGKIKIVNADDISVSNSEIDSEFIGEKKNETAILTEVNNKYAADSIKYRMEENEAIFYINSENVDINYFSPNKYFKLIYSEESKSKKYKDLKFRLAMVHHTLTPISDTKLRCSHRFILKKFDGKINEEE